MGGRQSKFLHIAYDTKFIPVVPTSHTLARLYLEEAHATDHAGVDAMIMKTKGKVWIPSPSQTARAVKGRCFTCKRRD